MNEVPRSSHRWAQQKRLLWIHQRRSRLAQRQERQAAAFATKARDGAIVGFIEGGCPRLRRLPAPGMRMGAIGINQRPVGRNPDSALRAPSGLRNPVFVARKERRAAPRNPGRRESTDTFPVMPAQAGIQCGGSRGGGLSPRSCVPHTRETNLHAATSILDARLRGHDGEVAYGCNPGSAADFEGPTPPPPARAAPQRAAPARRRR